MSELKLIYPSNFPAVGTVFSLKPEATAYLNDAQQYGWRVDGFVGGITHMGYPQSWQLDPNEDVIVQEAETGFYNAETNEYYDLTVSVKPLGKSCQNAQVRFTDFKVLFEPKTPAIFADINSSLQHGAPAP